MNELTLNKALKIIEKANNNGYDACIKVVNGKPVIRIYDNKITMEVKNGSVNNWRRNSKYQEK